MVPLCVTVLSGRLSLEVTIMIANAVAVRSACSAHLADALALPQNRAESMDARFDFGNTVGGKAQP